MVEDFHRPGDGRVISRAGEHGGRWTELKQRVRTTCRAPASQGGAQVLVEKVAQAVADSMYLAGFDWLLAVPVHAFVAALEAILKRLVGEVSPGHRIVARI